MGQFSGRVVAMAGALALAACQQTPPPQAPVPAASDPLAGHSWQIREIAGHGVVDGSAPTLAFAEGRVSGNGSCNRYMGQYQLSGGDHLTLSGLASTMMACPAPLLQQEDRLLDLLADVRSYAVAGEVLTLTTADGSRIRGQRTAGD